MSAVVWTKTKMIRHLVYHKLFDNDLRVVISLMILASSLWLFKFYLDRRHFFKMATLIPSAKNAKIFGLQFLGNSKDDNFETMRQFFRTSPDVFKFWMGSSMMVGISKPEHMEEILTNPKSYNKSIFIEFFEPLIGNGLFSAPMDIWKRHRKLINPVFNQKSLNSFVSIHSEKSEVFCGIIEKFSGQTNVDILDKLSSCTLDTICETFMALKIDAQVSESRYGHLFEKTLEIITLRVFNGFYHPKMIFDKTPIGRAMKMYIAELKGFTMKMIANRKAIHQQKMNGEYIEDKNSNQIKTFLDLLLEISHNGNGFTDKEIEDEVTTFIAAGTDTTAAAVSFCCMTLGMYPEYQQKLYEEVIEVLGADRHPTQDDLPKMKFTEMLIKETLRLFPIGPLLPRVLSGDIKLDGLVIPKDSVVLMGIIHLHRSPKYWKDPLKFNPYRFTPEEMEKKLPYSYLPFSAGPRNCIGQRYAMMLMKVLLSMIVRKFELKTDYDKIEDIQLSVNLMMRPKNGFKVTFEVRE